MTKLRYTRCAENDLLEAWLFIAEDSPQAADRVIDAIDREARRLVDHPHLGCERPELARVLRSWLLADGVPSPSIEPPCFRFRPGCGNRAS